MSSLAADAGGSSSDAQAPIQKAFDIRAGSRLELEVRLDRFGTALDVRGGRLLSVHRGRAASGRYFAAIRYSVPSFATRRRTPSELTALPNIDRRTA